MYNRTVIILLLLSLLLLLTAAALPVGGSSVADAPAAAQAPFLDAATVAVTANDLLYDTTRETIYASVPSSGGANGNSIVPISHTGEVGEAIFVGSEPNVMALSSDGRYLYVGIDGAAAYRRVDLQDGSVGPLWALGSGWCGPFHVHDMVVLANDPTAVVISRANVGCTPRNEGVAVYDDGVARPNATPGHTGPTFIAPSVDPATLYGYDSDSSSFGFYRLTIDETGIAIADVQSNLIEGYGVDIHYVGGLIYATSGRVLNPATMTLTGTFAATGPLVVDEAAGLVYFVDQPWPQFPRFKTFALDTFLPLHTADFLAPLAPEAVAELIALDADEWLVRLRDGRVLLLWPIEASAVTGRITDETGFPMAGVTVSVGPGQASVTDEAGYYTLGLPDAGTYTLTPSRPGYRFEPSTREVTVPPDATEQDFVTHTGPPAWSVCMPVVR